MPQFHGRNSLVALYDNTGACQNLSGDHNSTVFAWTRNNPDTTTFTKDTTQRIAGLRDATLTGAGIWNSAPSGLDQSMAGIMAGSLNTLVRYGPTNLTGCPVYTACMLLKSYQITSPVNGAVAFSYAFEIGSGSVSASTI